MPVLRRKQVWKAVQGGFSLLVNEERISPKSKRISCWNLFPDPSCGQNIHNGAYIWEVEQYWSRKELMKHQSPVAASDGWLPDQIAEVLKEQPKYLFETNMVQTRVARNDYEIWHGPVPIDAKTIADAGLALDMGEERLISAYVILCNDRIIKVAHNPDVFGSFPYDVFPWSERDNMPWGRGIVRQVRTPQRIVTAASRRRDRE